MDLRDLRFKYVSISQILMGTESQNVTSFMNDPSLTLQTLIKTWRHLWTTPLWPYKRWSKPDVIYERPLVDSKYKSFCLIFSRPPRDVRARLSSILWQENCFRFTQKTTTATTTTTTLTLFSLDIYFANGCCCSCFCRGITVKQLLILKVCFLKQLYLYDDIFF
jgi:hypothetical protein